MSNSVEIEGEQKKETKKERPLVIRQEIAVHVFNLFLDGVLHHKLKQVEKPLLLVLRQLTQFL